MIYFTGSNPGLGLHVVDVHGIWCEYKFLSGSIIFHLIYGEKVDKKFGNMQHVLEASIGDFDFDKIFSPLE
jgi:hypothetical protein